MRVKPCSQYDADLVSLVERRPRVLMNVAEDRSQFSVPIVCTACIPMFIYLSFNLEPRGKKRLLQSTWTDTRLVMQK